MALGAEPRTVLRMVIAQVLRLVLIGIADGVLASTAATRVVASLLFQTAPRDPVTYAAVATVFAAIGIAAPYLPARRAMRLDPLIALRTE